MASDQDMPKWDVALAALSRDEFRKKARPLTLNDFRGLAKKHATRLDDIMETFDDTRARAALQLCAEIGANGQAILFTHHAHLVELARDCIEGVAVVNMPS